MKSAADRPLGLSRARRRLASFLICALLAAAVPAANAAEADFAAGMRAHLDKKYEESRRIFEPLARAGNARAQFMMGTIFEQGLDVAKDVAEASYWYRRAAEGGNPSAQYNLGIFYQFGRGVPKDPAQAAIWLQRAAEQGHGRAQNNLSTFYFTGVGVQQDLAEAWKWLTLSADDLKGMGRKIALQNRAKIEAKMSPAQLADAKRRVADWRR